MLIITLAIFPGYYTGRAVHVHTKVFPEWRELPNGTFEAGRLSHTGQFFFDDDIVEVTSKVGLNYLNLISLPLGYHQVLKNVVSFRPLDVAIHHEPHQRYLGPHAQLG